ncbi:S8 family peptidase [Paraliomyxa miuraensis]|uniref:S8 family peptidase n=1 Tax=Paraliomyxa miuraensis TaxID=376150 RepID=UPI00224DD615|nr:S8 family peptidase [Paraliomyxa miuraensis]MCX4244270.1 S8 family peptidase [Paraliomyxa miuraensis]
MAKALTSLLRHRGLVAGAGLLASFTVLALDHGSADEGLAAEDITPQAVMTMASGLGVDPMSHTWLVDFVEPADGEGGSEEEIAAMVAELQTRLGPDAIAPAGFYSEGEHLFRLQGTLRSATELLDHPLVEGVEPEMFYGLPEQAMSALDGPSVRPGSSDDDTDAKKGTRFEPNDPMFGLQWHMEQIHAPEAWTLGNGDGAVVAVIDTGVAWKDAKGARRLPDLAGTAFVEGESFINGLPEGLDDHAHGSHVAGTIAQTTNNGEGVTGVAFGSTIMPLKVLSKDGRGSVGGIANAIRYAADHGAHVINMSLGGPLPSRVLAKAIEYAHGKGVTTVCAAGNERRSKVGYPAANKYAVAVSAVDEARDLTWYSNWGKDIDVAAPGGDTRADKNGDGHPDGVLQNTIKIQDPSANDYLWFQGTSMASPHAAGVAALIVGAGVTNPDEVERIMKETATNPTGKAWDEKYGAGIVDANAALQKAKGHYSGERAGLLGLLGLMGLSGLGLAGVMGRRRRLLATAGLGAGALVGSGALGGSLAYGLAGAFGGLGSPLWLSAAVPLGLAALLFGRKSLRGALTGVSLGYAALLAHGAVVLPTLLTGLPGGPTVDRLWLVGNAALALWLARAISRK